MSKFPAITKDIPIPLSLGLHIALLGAVLYAGMQLQGLKTIVERQWSYDMESAAWDKFSAINSQRYPDLQIPDIHLIRRNHAGVIQVPFKFAEN